MGTPAVSCQYTLQIKSVEIPPNTPATVNPNASIIHSAYDTSGVLNAGTGVPVTRCAYFHQAIGGGGTATIDLTALPGTNNGVVDGSGLRVQCFRIRAVDAAGVDNGAAVNITSVGAANPYDLAGAAFDATLEPGQQLIFFGNEATPNIGALACELTLSGGGAATDGCEFTIVMG